MVNEYVDWSKILHFTRSEFLDSEGGCNIKPQLIMMLMVARIIAGIPFSINDGCRTREDNAKLVAKGLAAEDSSHLEGYAADISCTASRQRSIMLGALRKAGFTRIGISKSFIHVDCDPTKDAHVTWVY